MNTNEREDEERLEIGKLDIRGARVARPHLHRSWDILSQSVLGASCSKFFPVDKTQQETTILQTAGQPALSHGERAQHRAAHRSAPE